MAIKMRSQETTKRVEISKDTADRILKLSAERGGTVAWKLHQLKNYFAGKKVDLREIASELVRYLQEHPEVWGQFAQVVAAADRIGLPAALLEQIEKTLPTTEETLGNGVGETDHVTAENSGYDGSCFEEEPSEETWNVSATAQYREGDVAVSSINAMVELVKTLKLYDVENMAAMMLVLYEIQMDYTQSQFSDLKKYITVSSLSQIKNGQTYYRDYENASEKEQKRAYLKDAERCWTDGIHSLEQFVELSVNSVCNFARKNMLVRVVVGMKDLDDDMQRIKAYLSVLENTVPRACVVKRMNGGDAESFAKEYQDFFERAIMQNIDVLQNCCLKNDKAFWMRIAAGGSRSYVADCMSTAILIDKL